MGKKYIFYLKILKKYIKYRLTTHNCVKYGSSISTQSPFRLSNYIFLFEHLGEK